MFARHVFAVAEASSLRAAINLNERARRKKGVDGGRYTL